MSKLLIEYRPPGDLVPYARNARTHSDVQIAQIMLSIKEFGFTNPILLAEDGVIVAGHGRLAAAQKLGLAEVPTITLKGLSEVQRRALVIADNKIATNAGWNDELLKLELGDLDAFGFDLTLTGFTAQEVANVFGLEGAPPSPDEPADNYAEQYGVIVVCKDAAHQENVFNDLVARGFECKVVAT